LGALVPSPKLALGIAVLLGAWMLKLAVADACSLAATLLAYHRSTAGMEPDPEWQARELKQKAAGKLQPQLVRYLKMEEQPAEESATRPQGMAASGG
jgi:hypothetical protein